MIRIGAVIGVGLVTACIAVSLRGQDAAAVRLASVPELIVKLDSGKFGERQQATSDLVKHGAACLRPLAKQYLEASTEKAWRIRQICEAICVDGDEATFFKTAAILRVLFSSPAIASQIDDLQRKWIAAKSERAGKTLAALGAELSITNQAQNEFNLNRAGMIQFFDPGGLDIEPKPANGESDQIEVSKKEPARPRDSKSLMKQVDEILLGSVDDNRKLALGEKVIEKVTAETDVAAARLAMEQVAADRQIIRFGVQQQVILIGGNQVFVDNAAGIYFPGNGNRIVFGKNWKGTETDFGNVVAINSLTSVEFVGINVTPAMIETTSRVRDLQHVKFDSCELAAEAVDSFSFLTKIQNLSFATCNLSETFLETLAEFKSLRSLRLERVQFASSLWSKLKPCEQLTYLELKGLQLSNDDFDALGTMKGLEQVQLIGAKFPLQKYREFQETHASIRMNVVNSAFLGVRGGSAALDLQDKGPCQITEVIADSAADKGGLQIGDVVETINGIPINSFRELVLQVSQFAPGDKVILAVKRENQPQELEITLAERPTEVQ